MKNAEVSPRAIYEAALMVSSHDELKQMPDQVGLSMFSMIERRLRKDGPPPTLAELQGIKAMATEHLWHPALNAVSNLSQG